MKFGGVALRCIWRFAGDRSYLLTGFMKPKKDGRQRFWWTQKHYVDGLGNIRDIEDDTSARNLTQVDWIDGYLFAELRNALDDAWQALGRTNY